MEKSSPVDRFHGVWLIFLIHGIGTLLPWNMFITANDYFVHYKFNATDDSDEQIEAKYYGENYLAYTGLASKLPNLILQLINFFYATGSGSINFRILFSLVVQLIVFVFTIVLAVLDTSSWLNLFFLLTMGSIVLINMANGVYQSCLFGLAANLPSFYTNAIVTGMNLSGTYSAIILILSIAISPDQQIAAIFYFSTAIGFLFICIITYFILIKTTYFNYFRDSSSIVQQTDLSGNANESTESNLRVLKRIWLKLLIPSFNIFMVYFISLSLFPGVLSTIQPMNDLIPEKYFNPVVCFLFFNFFAVLGNLCSGSINKVFHPLWLTIPIVTRALFIPYFIFCNSIPDKRQHPVYFDNDHYTILGTILLALTQGYYTSEAQMHLPKCVEPMDATVAGMIAPFMAMIGILAGIGFSPFINYLITIKW